MKKLYIAGATLLFTLVAGLGIFSHALAATPILSVTQPDVNNTIRITVSNADSNGWLSLSQRQGSSPTIFISNFGQTDGSGNFNQLSTLSSGRSSSQVEIFVSVNGQRSNSVFVTPYGYYNTGGNSSYNTVSLSQSTLTLNSGQTASVNIYGSNNYYNNSFYIYNGVNNNVANASINGNVLNVYAVGSGSNTITICQTGYSSQCANLYVTVNSNNYNTGTITFSNGSPSLSVGQTSNISIYTNYLSGNNYYISSNSNSNVVSAYISGSTLVLTGIANGNSTISVCQNSGQCGTVYVTVTGYNYNYNNNYNNNFTISPSSLSLNAGQNATAIISNSYYGNNYYTVSTNSNPSVASATISGNVVNVYANSYGTTSISICQNSNYQCNSLFVSVGGYTNGSVLGSSAYSNGTLISENGTIFVTYKNTKSGFANFESFKGLGYSLKNVVPANSNNLVRSNYIVNTPFASHPWGTWIISGTTIYFVDQYGLIPVSDYSIFTNNGGVSQNVVAANGYDMQRPILSIMTLNDSRLR